MLVRTRKWIIVASFTAVPLVALVACTDGTTPDCSSPEAGCSPDLSGSVGGEGGTQADSNTGYGDSATPVDSSKPTPTDAGDASLDAADAHG